MLAFLTKSDASKGFDQIVNFLNAHVIQRMHPNRGKIAELDANEDVTLEAVDVEVAMDADDTNEAEPAEVEEVIEVVTIVKLMTKVVTVAATTSTAAQVPKDEAFARQLQAELNANIKWDDVVDQVKRKEKQDNAIMRYQALKRKPVTKSQARKNMMVYLKNMARFKMDFFKINNDDVFTEAAPVALKLVQERFQSSEPKNFLDDFLLNTLKIMFEKPNVEASIWRDQRGRYGLAKVKSWKLFESCGVHIITFITTQMILLVEKKYPLTRFTLEQMLNNVRLEVEEGSEMSLELLRLVRRQLQEGYIPE
nr:hypothetical protein [Tanacetum cinerariifolium]GEX74162.1 hypothetical protein [Tanacetum cinerariifolium]